MKEFIVQEDDAGRRLDRVVRRLLKKASNTHSIQKNAMTPSLSKIYSAIRKGEVKLNGMKVGPACLTKKNDVLSIEDALLEGLTESCFKQKKKIEVDVLQHRIKNVRKKEEGLHVKKSKCFEQNSILSILFKGEHLLFINKGLGLLTHGENSIDEMIKEKYKGRNSLSFSVGALHRLDKNTTGILTFSQSLLGAQLFSKAIKDGLIDRYYLGINEGLVKTGIWHLSHKIIQNSITNNANLYKEITEVRLIEYNKQNNLSLVVYKLVTGRKHQIRKGAEYFETPLFCDNKYGSKRKEFSAYFLHAFALQFKNTLDFLPSIIVAPMPKRFIEIINKIFPHTRKKLFEIGENAFLKKITQGIF